MEVVKTTNEEEILENIKKFRYKPELVMEYIRNCYCKKKLIKTINGLDNFRKVKYYQLLAKEKDIKSSDVKLFGNDKNKKIVISCLLEENQDFLAYQVMKEMKYPNLFLQQEDIDEILKRRTVKDVISDFGNLFVDKLVIRSDYFQMLENKDCLNEENFDKIFKRAISSQRDYLNVTHYLDIDEKKKITKLFIKEKSDKAEVAYHILEEGNYESNDLDRLLLVIAMFGTAEIIYEALVNAKITLNKNQKLVLEKSLRDTGNIEYIAYYYFFKDREKFKELFGSELLFLSYLEMNKNSFRRRQILEIVVLTIKEEQKMFVDAINGQIGIQHIKTLQTK